MKKLLIYLVAFLSTISLPLFHIGFIYKLMFDKVLVDRDDCSCSCWDRFFKGNYEHKIAGFKHLYFNSTWQTALIWVISMLAFISFYEVVKHTCDLWNRRRLQWWMVAVFATSLYPNYYAWWAYFNYINDSFYSQLTHQTIFTASELYVTVLSVFYFDKDRSQSGRHIAVAMMITLFHVVCASKDQFLFNVLMMGGMKHQVSRDIGFMLADIANLALLSHSYRRLATKKDFKTLEKQELMLSLLIFISVALLLAFV